MAPPNTNATAAATTRHGHRHARAPDQATEQVAAELIAAEQVAADAGAGAAARGGGDVRVAQRQQRRDDRQQRR